MIPTTRTITALFLLLVFFASSPISSEEKAAATKQPAKSPGARMWWNQKAKVDTLSLTDEQRAKMDSIFGAFMKERQTAAQGALTPVTDALSRGDLDAARKQRDAAVDKMATPLRMQIDMMIDVVGVLTLDQRKTLNEKYPAITSRLWIRSAPSRATVTQKKATDPE